MKPKVIREMTHEEVQDRLTEELANYERIKMHHSVSPLENPLQLRQARRTIARLKTELVNRKQETANKN